MKLKSYLLTGISVFTVSCFTGAALLLAGPTTPLTFAFGAVSDHLEPYFTQNWNLFAPDPVSEERGVLARVKCDTDRVSRYVDISSEAIRDVQGSRLFPSRESRIVSNGILERFRTDEVVDRLRENKRGLETVQRIRDDEKRSQDNAELVLARYAGLKIPCAQNGERPKAVQLRYVFHKFPGWSERNNLQKTGTISQFESKWIEL